MNEKRETIPALRSYIIGMQDMINQIDNLLSRNDGPMPVHSRQAAKIRAMLADWMDATE